MHSIRYLLILNLCFLKDPRWDRHVSISPYNNNICATLTMMKRYMIVLYWLRHHQRLFLSCITMPTYTLQLPLKSLTLAHYLKEFEHVSAKVRLLYCTFLMSCFIELSEGIHSNSACVLWESDRRWHRKD